MRDEIGYPNGCTVSHFNDRHSIFFTLSLRVFQDGKWSLTKKPPEGGFFRGASNYLAPGTLPSTPLT
jgi:hypothetical protein